MFRDPEKESIPLKIWAGYGAYAGMGIFATAEAIKSGERQDSWMQRIEDLRAHVEKARKDLKGPFHHLAVVDIGETQEAIDQVKANPPQGPEGLQVAEAMAPFVVGGALLAVTVACVAKHMPVIGNRI